MKTMRRRFAAFAVVLACSACGSSGPRSDVRDDAGSPASGSNGSGGDGVGVGTGGSSGAGGVTGAAGASVVSPYAGYWEGKTGQNEPVSFHVTSSGQVPDMLLRLQLSLAGGTCTATFNGDAAAVLGDGFTSIVRVPGISVTPTATTTFSSSSAAAGTYTGSSGSFTIVCGSTLTIGSGTILSDGTFTLSRVATCGNGVVETGEECDPPSTTCDVDCQRVPICGDGFVDAPETCDDGNTTNGDGCSSTCMKEVIPIVYPTALPATGQVVAAGDFVTYQITGVTPGTAYVVSTRTGNDVDLYVYDDAALTVQLCSSSTLSGNETCTATPTGGSFYVVVDSFASVSTTFTLDVVDSSSAQDAGTGPMDSGFPPPDGGPPDRRAPPDAFAPPDGLPDRGSPPDGFGRPDGLGLPPGGD